MIMENASPFYESQFYDDFDVAAIEDEPMEIESMFAETTGGDYSEFVDDEDDLGFRLIADEEKPEDLESLFNSIGEKSRGDSCENRLADPLSSAAWCSELASYGANEHSETQSGSLACPCPHDSEALASRDFFDSGGSFVAERQSFNCGFFNLGDSFAAERQSFNSGFQHFIGSVADRQMPGSAHVTPWLSNHGVNQDFLSFSKYSTIGSNNESGNSNDAFGFNNGNHPLLDRFGIDNGMIESLTRDGYQTLEVPENAEAPAMNLNGYCDFLYEPNHEFSNTCINEPYWFDSSRQILPSSNHNYGMSSNAKSESEEYLMQNLSKNSAVNYEIVTEKPDGVGTPVDWKSDIGPYVSETCLPSGESSIGKPAKESTCGYHGGLHMLNKKQGVSVKNEKHDALVTTPGTACTKQSPTRALRKDICKKVKFETNDKQSGHQVPSQDFPHQESRTSLPDDGLAVPLLRHQRSALSWMSKKETKSTHCCGGILADDQGLGKTISAIALILKERSPPCSSVSATEENYKETETLCLDEEDEEIATNMQTKCCVSAGTLVVCPTSVLRQWNEELQNKVISEANLSVLVYYGVNRTKDPFELAKYDVVLTTYAIVSMEVPKQPLDDDEDETKIKISPTKKRKYPPTSDDTPKKEPFEPIDRPLAKLRWFRVILDEAQSIKNYKTQVARACWGLKAKRRWCLSGTPIQNSVDDLYSYFRFLRYGPFAVFKKFCSQIKAPIQRNPVAGYKRLQVILKIIMLRRTKGTLYKGEPIISLPPKTIILKKVDFTAEERVFYRSLEAESRAQFAEYAAAGTVNQNYVNILLMLLRLRQACDHPLLVKECNLTTYWRSSVEKAKELPPEKINRLLNCLEASLAICSICNDPPEDAVVTTCEHVFCNQCILEHLSNDDNQCPYSECKKLLSRSSVFCKSTLSISISDDIPNSDSGKSEVDSLRVEAAKALDSSKIKAVLEVLQSISKPQDATVNDNNIEGNSVVREKAIVFSQWTRMLDLVEVCLKDSCIGYRRLDGTMSVVARDKAVKDFNTLPEVTVIIMSLKAASLGLNMVSACHVILLDLWWNPTMEDQAIDRAHRIGQTRPVTVFRFTVKDTIEDRILALQEKKREMVASAFGDDDNGGSQTRLTLADIKYLFQA